MTLAVALMMVWKTQIPAQCQEARATQAAPTALLWGKQGSWQPLAHTGHPCVLENSLRLWQRQGGDAGNHDPLFSNSSETVRNCVIECLT